MTDRLEWLRWRQKGIGASDVAAIVGLSPWGSPMSVYLDKTTEISEDPTEAMEWGTRLENAILDGYEERTGEKVTDRQLTLEHPDHPHHRATIDGRIERLRIVEAKNTSDWSWDEIPDHYRIQGQWQMHVSGDSFVDFAVLHGGNRLSIYHDERDDKVIGQLVTRVDEFWERHIEGGHMPAVDESAATHRALRNAWESTEYAVKLSDGADAALRRRKELKAQIKALDAEVKACESVVFAELGDADVGMIDGEIVATWKTVSVPESVRKGYEFRRLTLRGEYR